MFAVLASTVIGIDNGFQLPAMGWSALYGAPFSRVSEENVVAAAQALNSSGLLSFGYNRVNLDDWYAERDPVTKKIKGATANFPSGMAVVSEKIHSAGCLFGVYSAASQRTCANFSASLFNEVNDANTFANEWKIDMLKYDSCIYDSHIASRARYEAMGRALNATGRQILYSVEGWSPEDDATWGPAIANSWRTGSDIWPSWDNMPNCILNNLYQTNYAAKFHIVGKGFNDPDMLQPPNTLITVRTPGLAPEESYTQFKLWVIMKSPLVLSVNYQQLPNLKTLEPTYYALLTNREILAINQDLSPQAVLVRQFPSTAQQNGGGRGGLPIPVSSQVCGEDRADQRWIPGKVQGTVQLDGTSLCLTQNGTQTGVVLRPCSEAVTKWGMGYDEQFHVGSVAGGQQPTQCITSSTFSDAPAIENCQYAGPLPPPLNAPVFGSQAYVWGPTTKQIVSGGAACLTAGLTNYDGRKGNNGPKWITNNGTLEHEVWMGDLTPQDGAKRRVLALFNKADEADTLVAPADLYTRGLSSVSSVKARDVVNHQDLSLTLGSPITVNVPRHGVALYVLTFP